MPAEELVERAPRAAGSNDPCKIDTCNPATGGCIVGNAPNGTLCEDGDLCTVGDTCQNGTCQSGNAVDCSHLDTQCREGFCDQQTGNCSVRNKPDSTACDDGNPCTENDTCQGGVCTPGTQIANCVTCSNAADCPQPSSQCQQAVCTQAGICAVENKPNNTACDDGNPCTNNDKCQGGVCVGTQIANCVTCSNAAECNDGNPCTDDACQAGVCVHTPKTCGGGEVCCPAGTTRAGECKKAPGSPCTRNNQGCNACVSSVCT
jgi:hypothetical protein